MPTIKLTTLINCPIERCFDLSRSIDLHLASASKSQEKAIAGKKSGLIGFNETVTWQATHFGFKLKLTSKITAYEKPYYFTDEQINGPFKSFKHQHFFNQVDDKVIMKDLLEFQTPLGAVGKLFNKIILTNYLKNFLLERNATIKEMAEKNSRFT